MVVCVNSVDKNIFLINYFKTKSFIIIIINTEIMPYFITQILVIKNFDTSALFAIFPELMSTYIIW